MTFEEAAKKFLDKEIVDFYTTASPETQKEKIVQVSFDDLISLWNAGVEAGLEGKE